MENWQTEKRRAERWIEEEEETRKLSIATFESIQWMSGILDDAVGFHFRSPIPARPLSLSRPLFFGKQSVANVQQTFL